MDWPPPIITSELSHDNHTLAVRKYKSVALPADQSGIWRNPEADFGGFMLKLGSFSSTKDHRISDGSHCVTHGSGLQSFLYSFPDLHRKNKAGMFLYGHVS